MARRKRLKLDIQNIGSLQDLMQEVYTDACTQIKDAQNTINFIVNSTEPLDTDEFSKVSKGRTDALKIKDSAIKIKLDIAKLQNDVIKRKEEHDMANDSEDEGESLSTKAGEVNFNDFTKLREVLDNNKDE